MSGQFTVTQTTTSSTDTVVSYSVQVGSTATDGGVDYTTLSGTVTILAGQTSAVIDVTGIIDDTIVEANETVIVKLTSITSGDPAISIDRAADTATVTIFDNDRATVSIAKTTDADEAGPVPGQFTVTQTTTSSTDTVVSYSVQVASTATWRRGLHHAQRHGDDPGRRDLGGDRRHGHH